MVEGGRTIARQAMAAGGGNHGGVVGAHRAAGDEHPKAILVADLDGPLAELGVGGHTAGETQPGSTGLLRRPTGFLLKMNRH